MSTAQAQKLRVEDLSGRTESSSRWANPDGSWTVETTAGQVRTRDDKGDLVPVDPSLVKTPDGFEQRSGDFDTSFSAGGDADLAEVTTASDKSITISADDQLPVPKASGSELRYADAAGGEDLVVRSFAEGFNFSVVIPDRPFVRPLTTTPGVPTVPLGLR